ncbi:MAG: SufD family Fe-S cluster assembly protein [Thermoplasmata archaeon]|nr:SufD family Fe-S cluster assembly protein [Thermoplasmata archaeon]
MAGAVPKFAEWLEQRTVDELSSTLSDPESFAELRRQAFRLFSELPMEPDPLYRKYGYFAGVDLAGADPVHTGRPVHLPPTTPNTIRVVHDAAGSHIHLPPSLKEVGVRIETLPEIWAAKDPTVIDGFLRAAEVPKDRLTALAAALLNRGYRLTIPDGCALPIHVQDYGILSAPHQALSVRRSLRIGARARLLVSEEVYSAPDGADHQRLYASSTDLDAGDDSQVAYLTVHAPDPNAVSIYSRHATTGARSKVGWIMAGFGGFRTKARNFTLLSGQGSDVEDLQTFYGDQDQAYDSGVNLTHTATDTHGQSITRGVFKDRSRGMSRGLVRIEKGARKTISYLSEHAMLLSRGARSDTIPILEILCRDVKATHSSSVAPVDPERIFYLESRGLPESSAIRMIGEGFLSHVFGRAPIAQLRDVLYPLLAARWDGTSISWKEGELPNLPALSFSDIEVGTDWRFDSKLR